MAGVQEMRARACPRQFDFARHWRKKIVPLLSDRAVVTALTFGLMLYDQTYREGDPPWLLGRGGLNGQRVRPGFLSWYQPWGRCHYIAPFCWAVARKVYPDLEWGFVSGDRHTVVVGYRDAWQEPEWVMDILLFRQMSAKESLEFAQHGSWLFYPSLTRYAASFCTDPQTAEQVFAAQVERLVS